MSKGLNCEGDLFHFLANLTYLGFLGLPKLTDKDYSVNLPLLGFYSKKLNAVRAQFTNT
jgi:hypothetical protein